MLKIYGSLRCPDCVDCCQDLDQAKVEYEFLDFDTELRLLKDFLKLRDSSPLFDAARAEGSIGIPCIVKEDGSLGFDWKVFM